MLEPLLGSTNAERALIFIQARGEGYAREIALFFETDLYGIQKQLDKLEVGGILVAARWDERACTYSIPAIPSWQNCKPCWPKP